MFLHSVVFQAPLTHQFVRDSLCIGGQGAGFTGYGDRAFVRLPARAEAGERTRKIRVGCWRLLLLLLSRFSRVRLCDPRDGSPLGSLVPGILQARTLEWVAISFSNA